MYVRWWLTKAQPESFKAEQRFEPIFPWSKQWPYVISPLQHVVIFQPIIAGEKEKKMNVKQKTSLRKIEAMSFNRKLKYNWNVTRLSGGNGGRKEDIPLSWPSDFAELQWLKESCLLAIRILLYLQALNFGTWKGSRIFWLKQQAPPQTTTLPSKVSKGWVIWTEWMRTARRKDPALSITCSTFNANRAILMCESRVYFGVWLRQSCHCYGTNRSAPQSPELLPTTSSCVHPAA